MLKLIFSIKWKCHPYCNRATEIKEWVEIFGENENYLIIDDDLSINGLSENIKERCVMTKPLIGFDTSCLENSLSILRK